MGYRYYDKAGVPVRFAFGHGLSYTRFSYSDLWIEGRTVRVTVANTGSREGTEAELEQMSVLNHVTDAFPPAFVMTAEGDFLAEQARPLVERLHQLGAEAEYHYYGDRNHVLGHVFHCDIRSEAANRCNREECEFFKRHLNR